jgi:Skp family chaperone for outer membrane proteins
LPIALGALALVAVAMGIAWTQGWIGTRATDTRIVAVDAGKAKLEADLATAEKARAEAELRAKAADADALRSRAESEAATLKAKAEAEAAATKAKAQADAAAMRSQAALEASQAKARAATAPAVASPPPASPATVAKAPEVSPSPPPPVVPPASSSVAPTSYDGVWTVTQQCAAIPSSPAFNRQATFVVMNGEFVLERGKPGEPGWGVLRGRPEADGTIVLTGTGISPVPATLGQAFSSRFEGAWSGDRFRLKGKFGSRPCLIELFRR